MRYSKSIDFFHQTEKAYVLATFIASIIKISRFQSDLWQAMIIWIVLVVAAVIASILPKAPRPQKIFAEAYLTLLLVGAFVAEHPRWLPWLSKNRIASENVPLIDRRYIAWNVACGVALIGAGWTWMLFSKRPQSRPIVTIIAIIIASVLGWFALILCFDIQ